MDANELRQLVAEANLARSRAEALINQASELVRSARRARAEREKLTQTSARGAFTGTRVSPLTAQPALCASKEANIDVQTLAYYREGLSNPNTRDAYRRAVVRFRSWCSARGLAIASVHPEVVATYLEHLQEELSVASVQQHLAALRHWFEWLRTHGAIELHPAAAIRGPRSTSRPASTPMLTREDARRLLAALQGDDLLSRRDRALICMMLLGCVRVTTLVKMRVRDFRSEGVGRASLFLRESGRKARRLPAHHSIRESVRAYLAAAELAAGSRAPLFQTLPRRTSALSGKPLGRGDVLAIVKRRCLAAGLSAAIGNHSLRATGIGLHVENGGHIEDTAALAGHVSMRSTQRYSRPKKRITQADVERVRL